MGNKRYNHGLFGNNILALFDGKIRLDTLLNGCNPVEIISLALKDADVGPRPCGDAQRLREPMACSLLGVEEVTFTDRQVIITTVAGIELRCTEDTELIAEDGSIVNARDVGPGQHMRSWEAGVVQVIRAAVLVDLAAPHPVYRVLLPPRTACAFAVGSTRTATTLMLAYRDEECAACGGIVEHSDGCTDDKPAGEPTSPPDEGFVGLRALPRAV